MTLGRFNSLEELINSIDMGLDIEFYLYGNRYIFPLGRIAFLFVNALMEKLHFITMVQN